MGWTSPYETKQDAIGPATNDGKPWTGKDGTIYHAPTETFKYTRSGAWGILYITKDGKQTPLIFHVIISGKKGNYAEKSQTEDSGPYDHDVPLSLLTKVPPPPPEYDRNGWAAEWRKRVAGYNEEKARLSERRKSINVGDTIVLPKGWRTAGIPLKVSIAGRKVFATDPNTGRLWGIPRRALAEATITKQEAKV